MSAADTNLALRKVEDAVLRRVFGVAQLLAKGQQTPDDTRENAENGAENQTLSEMLYCENEHSHLQHE
ncbi:MAG: hypothetical protein SF162_01160 [bacterium]|nr:hypothetical protein [bacterium]